MIHYENHNKPRVQYKSTRKFPSAGYWVFVEKYRENNKWKALIRDLRNNYGKDIYSTGYCKDEDSAWASLYKKIMK